MQIATNINVQENKFVDKNGLLILGGILSMKYGKNVTKYFSLFENLEINIIKNDVSIRAKISEGSRLAVLRMMREKIINSKKFASGLGKDLSKAIHQSLEKSGSRSVISDLLKERIIKV